MLSLDVIVPHYKEDEKTIMHALSMIDNQIGIDKSNILITVVTDNGGYKLDEEMLRSVISLPINFIETDKHLGPGYARQYAMDRTSAKYITFCDSDDIFISPFVFKYFEDKLKENSDLECIFTAYLEEMNTDNGYVYNQKDDDVSITCLHGKLYKRQFLKDNNITFPNLMVSEDGAFNFRVLCHAKTMIFDDDTLTYVWKFNPKSITREGTELIDYSVNVRSFKQSIDGFEKFFDETINSPTSQVNTKVISAFINSLYKQWSMLEPLKNLSNLVANEIDATKQRLDLCYNKYKEYFND